MNRRGATREQREMPSPAIDSPRRDGANRQGLVTRRRVGGAMLLTGSVLGALIALLAAPMAVEGVLACSGAAALIGAVLLLRPRALPAAASHVLVVLITAIIAVATRSIGLDGSGAADSEVLFVLVALYAFFFFSARAGFAHVALAGLAYATVLWGQVPLADGVARWATTIGAMAVAGVMVDFMNRRANTLVAELDANAAHDPLTGIFNRRGLDERLGIEIARARRTGEPLTMLALDLDGLKPLNDRYGHAAGDDALALVAEELATSLRDVDVLARIGGDEFVIVLPGCDQDAGTAIADQLCEKVRGSSRRESWPVTVSVGVATAAPLPLDPVALLAAADSALYRGKALGRDQVARAGRAELRRAQLTG